MTAVHGEPRSRSTSQGWTVDDSTFGARLALVRQRMQWNIKEAARECGIPAASWGTWEGGAMPRRYTEMCRLIADRTGCDFGWLLAGPGLKGRSDDGELTERFHQLTVRPLAASRPPDNRPNGRGLTSAPAGPGRTAFVDRAQHRRRDR
jgi:transcriptional regulator with XRE-family HTH domain